MSTTIPKIEFIDLQAQRRAMGEEVLDAINTVLQHGGYIFGPEVKQLEEKLCSYTGANETITCANGTDALRLLLMAYGIGPNDAVFVPTFTFASTAEVVAESHATPIFVDICPETFNMDVASLERAILVAQQQQLNPKGIIAVDLFGLPANYPVIHDIAKRHNLWVIADSAQSFGGMIGENRVGTLAKATATSFFPSKPLAGYGDGGAIFTTDPELANVIRSLRNHGCGVHRYDHIHIGLNSRLDTIQAAILLKKLELFPHELMRRNKIAGYYTQEIQDLVQTQRIPASHGHAYGLYTIACEQQIRDLVAEQLAKLGIPTNVYYRRPLHLQPAYLHFPRASEHLKHAERATQTVLSLPMHPYLTDVQIEYVASSLKHVLAQTTTQNAKMQSA